jgi:hypothetical protein
MNTQEVKDRITQLEKGIADLKDLLPKPKTVQGIQILAMWEKDFSYVHYWDDKNPEPTIIYLTKGEAPVEYMVEYICQAFNKLPPSSFERKLEYRANVGWPLLPENFQKLVDVFQHMEFGRPTTEEVEEMRRSEDVIHCMSGES